MLKLNTNVMNNPRLRSIHCLDMFLLHHNNKIFIIGRPVFTLRMFVKEKKKRKKKKKKIRVCCIMDMGHETQVPAPQFQLPVLLTHSRVRRPRARLLRRSTVRSASQRAPCRQRPSLKVSAPLTCPSTGDEIRGRRPRSARVLSRSAAHTGGGGAERDVQRDVLPAPILATWGGHRRPVISGQQVKGGGGS